MTSRIGSVILMAALSGIALVVADEPPKESPGGGLYRIYCANCHGTSAEGDGPVADVLTIPPTDLTVISRNNRGEFPYRRLFRTIDGRESVRGHGSQMPIWGIAFQEWDMDSRQEDDVKRRILQLVEYLESIQRDDED